MATNMDLVSITTTLLVLYLTSLNTGHAGIIRRDVPPIAIPVRPMKPLLDKANTTVANDTEDKNCTIEVVAFIPFTEKTNLNESTIAVPEEEKVHESYPNPPVPNPPSPTTTTKNDDVKSEPEKNDDGTKKWGFDDKYLASQNKYATRRNVVFDVVAGDTMAFSNYNVLGHQEASFGKKRK